MSLHINGTANIARSTFSGPNTVTGYTLAVWANYSNLYIWAEIQAGTAGGCELNVDGGLHPQGAIKTSSSSVKITGTGTLSVGTWHHYCLSRSTTGGVLYVDGVSVGSISNSVGPGESWTGVSAGGTNGFGGQADLQDLIAYSVALSAAEVMALYSRRSGVPRPERIEAWYPLRGGQTRNIDYGPYGRNLVNTGTVADGTTNAPVSWGTSSPLFVRRR